MILDNNSFNDHTTLLCLEHMRCIRSLKNLARIAPSINGRRRGVLERALELYRAAERRQLLGLLAHVETGTNS